MRCLGWAHMGFRGHPALEQVHKSVGTLDVCSETTFVTSSDSVTGTHHAVRSSPSWNKRWQNLHFVRYQGVFQRIYLPKAHEH